MQVFLSRIHMASCALACAYACSVPHQWPFLLHILQAATASLQEQQPPLEPDQQELVDQLRKVDSSHEWSVLPLVSSRMKRLRPRRSWQCITPCFPLSARHTLG